MNDFSQCAAYKPRVRPPRQTLWGTFALAFFALHAVTQISLGRPENLLWTCHAANVAIGVGLLADSRRLVASGVLILLVGVPAWLINLALGGFCYPTSLLTHYGGVMVGLVGLQQMGRPERIWPDASLIVALLVIATRYVASAESNVNFAFRGWPHDPGVLPANVAVVLFLAIWPLLLWIAEKGLSPVVDRLIVQGGPQPLLPSRIHGSSDDMLA